MTETSSVPVAIRGTANVDQIFYTLSVNFLLYVLLIIVFYMLVRFYLEEETTHKHDSYASLATFDEVEKMAGNDDELKLEMEIADDSDEQANFIPSQSPTSSKSPVPKSGSFLNINEWGEPEGTKQEVIQKAIFCAVGLNLSFCIWGLVQERMLTRTYDGDFFEFSYGLVFLNRLGGLVLSTCLMYYFRVDWISSPLWEYSFPSVANMLSSWCQYEALKYVSFPTQMLAKAFKIVPVLLMGKFLHNNKYGYYEYVSAALIGFGLWLFLDSSERLDFSQNGFGAPETMHGAMVGVVLLILFLFFDSFTGQWQTRMFQLHKSMSPLQMMLIMNAFSAVFSFITLVHQEEFFPALYFVYSHKVMVIHLLIFCVCSTVGQLFIFYTVKNFGAVVFSIIMSMRILFSTLLSCVVYDHPITYRGMMGMAIVFGSISYRIRKKTEGRSLIRWKENDMAKVVFNEWHEHLDI